MAAGGGVTGVFQKGTTYATLTGYEYSFHPGMALRTKAGYELHLGASLRQLEFTFVESGVSKKASYSLLGGSAGLAFPMDENFSFQVMGEYAQQSALSVLAVNTLLLNSTVFRYSTLQTYNGEAATVLRMTVMHDKIDGGFSKAGRYRTGLGVSLGQQHWTKETSKVRTSSSATLPDETLLEKTVDYSLKTATVDFFIGLSL